MIQQAKREMEEVTFAPPIAALERTAARSILGESRVRVVGMEPPPPLGHSQQDSLRSKY